MNLSHLHYFTTLAETKNFQDTARRKSITTPTLSQAINGLERELDCQLFIRKKGSVELTEDGTLFYQYVTTSLRFLQNGIDLLKQSGKRHKREIRIGSMYSTQSKEWSHLIYEFRKKMDYNIAIAIQQAGAGALRQKLKTGAVDIAFLDTAEPDNDISYVPCWSQEATLIVNKHHPFAKRESVSLDDLADHYLISYDLQGPLGHALAHLIAGHNLQVGCRYEDEITLASIVSANPDVMAIACHSWLLEAFHNEVVIVPIKEAPKNFRQLYLAYQRNEQHTKTVDDFISLAKKLYSCTGTPVAAPRKIVAHPIESTIAGVKSAANPVMFPSRK